MEVIEPDQDLKCNSCKGHRDQEEAVFMVTRRSMGGLWLFMASRGTYPDCSN